MNNLLLEIGTEEIPARFMPNILKDLKTKAEAKFKDSRIDFASLETFGTDRRLVLIINQIAAKQADCQLEIKGPSKNVPQIAIEGFLKKNLLSKDNLIEKDGYFYGTKKVIGKETNIILPVVLKDILNSLYLPIAMRWQTGENIFIRPVHWLLALLDKEIIDFEFAGIKSSNYSRGHRFLRALGRVSGDLGIAINNIDDYFNVLEENFVIADQNKRKAIIKKQILENEEIRQGQPIIDDKLLDEVTFLTEFPEVLAAFFDKKYLELPKEILIMTMQKNQKYFPVKDSIGNLLNVFLIVSNNATNKKNVIEGNQKVLKARLEDASFFYQEDLKTNFTDKRLALKNIVYQQKVGTVFAKTERMLKIADLISKELNIDKDALVKIRQAIILCKNDLCTQVVYEFPDLQGIMGEIYALKANYEKDVAKAIFEHYLPRFSGDILPSNLISSIVAIADKLDSIISCFSADLIPSGSEDPYALRRAAYGILKIIIECNFDFNFYNLILNIANSDELSNKIFNFLQQRLKYILKEEESIDHDIIEAVLNIENPIKAYQLSLLYQSIKKEAYFKAIVASALRIKNLAIKCESHFIFKENLLKEKAELAFWQLLKNLEKDIKDLSFLESIELIAKNNNIIETFFADILVMADDIEIKENRLCLLKKWQDLFDKFGQLDKIIII